MELLIIYSFVPYSPSLSMSILLLSLTRILPIEIDMLRIDNIFHTSAWLVSFGRTYYNVNSLVQVLLNSITVIALNVVSLIVTKAIYIII